MFYRGFLSLVVSCDSHQVEQFNQQLRRICTSVVYGPRNELSTLSGLLVTDLLSHQNIREEQDDWYCYLFRISMNDILPATRTPPELTPRSTATSLEY
ncbi:unnamed protein product [Bursaphelenchus okinawaensis]|uniref:Uncharacterized protein n=1 Tax=Bursaphelenchus okinawaensis TaxID=465554 RepID=A0A811JPX1_9BILA|nr:unnamed protein product [Bursaphelenchus okinawaensis]CAG9077181.1 unnamed protein product [Bursaphelenchus okinawaensis]